MGCSNSPAKKDELEKPIKVELEDVEVDEINDFCEATSEIVLNIEKLRRMLVDDAFEVFMMTGSCSYKSPDIYKSFLSLLRKIASDTKGKLMIEEVTISSKHPFMACESNLSVYGSSAVNTLADFCANLTEAPRLLEEIQKERRKLEETVNSPKIEEFDMLIGDLYKENRFKIPGLVKKFHKNISRAKKALNIIDKLEERLKLQLADLDRAEGLLQDQELINKINSLYEKEEEEESDTVKEANEVNWEAIEPQERTKSAKKGFKFWNEKSYAAKDLEEI